jgi:glycosyltransferase involved in cell wall biosynthesis
MHRTLIDLGCPPHKLIYNPYGPREKFFAVQPNYQPTVLSVGRFTDIKANYLVLMAFQKALHQAPNARLVMAGSGELLETCRTLAEVWKMTHAVEFPGPVPHTHVHELFANACCFAQHSLTPSYGDAEGTPNTILEASAAGLPVVATRHAGIPDVVIHGQTGLLVDERDVDRMGSHLAELLNDPVRCRRLGENARLRISRNFSSASHISRLNEAIRCARSRDIAGITALAIESLKVGSLE